MLKKNSGFLRAIHQITDIITVGSSFGLAYFVKQYLPSSFGGLTGEYNYTFCLLLALISFHISLRLFGAYEPYRTQKLSQIVITLFKAVLTGIAGIVFISYLLHIESVSRILLGLFGIFAFIGLIIFKFFLYKALTYTRLNDLNTRSILVIGSRQRTLDFIKAVRRRKESGYRILGCLETNDLSENVGDRVYESVKIIGLMSDFKKLLKENAIDEVVFGIPLKKIENAQDYIYFAEEMGKNVRVLPDFQINAIKYYPQTAKTKVEDFLGVSTLALSSVPDNSNDLLLKSCIDYSVAAFSVVLGAPVFLVLALLVKLTSKGPIFFSQERAGLNGRRFKVHKFRTMVVNAEELKETLLEANEMDGPVFKMKKDPRITPIGRFLRKTSLDELPQLFNVLKGEMSLVGPRPPLPSEVEKYRLWQRRRLSMKPGLTCIWQVSGRNNISFEEWMNMDLEYIDNWSLKLDLKLLLLTFREVAFGGGS